MAALVREIPAEWRSPWRRAPDGALPGDEELVDCAGIGGRSEFDALMAKEPVIVNVSESQPVGWDWIGGRFPEDRFRWISYTGLPQSVLEMKITRPRLSRYRAARQGIQSAITEDAVMIVTHEPRMAAAVGNRYQRKGLTIPHLAFGFSFSHLPTGSNRQMIAKAISQVDRFVCFSSLERKRYADAFGIDPDRVGVVRWSVAEPDYDLNTPAIEQGDYLCAIGGEGRDVETLLLAMARLPDLRLALVTRPANVEGLTIPPNVDVRTNIPLTDVWNITHHARLHVLPLLSRNIPCGHGTLIMAMQLRTPSVVSESEAMVDYVENGQTGLTCPPQDAGALAETIKRLWNDDALIGKLANQGRRFAIEECSEAKTAEYFCDYLRSHSLL